MSGHSHWATIKRKKETLDQQKGKAFARASKEIFFAIREGGNVSDPNFNAYLRTALEKAKALNLPKENIQKILDKSDQKAESLVDVMYEGIGPGGSAYLIRAATDNTNRTLGEVRLILTKANGKLGEKGSISYLFTTCGVVKVEARISEETVLQFIEIAGALDMEKSDEWYEIIVPYDNLSKALEQAKDMSLAVEISIEYRAKNMLDLVEGEYEKALHIMESLENNDDVQEVFVNFLPHE